MIPKNIHTNSIESINREERRGEDNEKLQDIRKIARYKETPYIVVHCQGLVLFLSPPR